MGGIEPPKIGCIIATYNRPRSLMRILDNLADQLRIDLKNKVLVGVVDDGSDVDLTGLFPPYPFEFHYLYRNRDANGLPRVYSSRNISYNLIRSCDLVLQLDDDLTFHSRLLSEMQNMSALYHEKHWAWIARLSDNHDRDIEAGYHRGPDGRWYDGKVQWMTAKYSDGGSAGLLLPRQTWDAIGGYDERYDGSMGAADQDLLLRIQKIGGHLMLAPYFFNIEDDETESWREPMIERALKTGRERNEAIFERKHPNAVEWTNV